MKIIKYRKASNGKYKVELDNGMVLVLYEETILKYNFLLTKEIDEETLLLADQYNQECDVYYVALKRLNNRLQTVFDLHSFLLRKEYLEDLIDKAISKLSRQGYLDDKVYARSYIHDQMITTSKGPYRLEKELLEKQVDISIIQEEMIAFTKEEQIKKIEKVINRGIQSNHTRGGVILKQKIFQDLKSLGHDISLITNILDHYSFSADSDIAKKEYNKLLKKYQRKYHGEELKRKIREKLYQKGLKYEANDDI